MTSTELIPAVTLPVPARKHRWDQENVKRLAAAEFRDGNGRTERQCLHCLMWKITVHPPDGRVRPWREWRTADGKVWRGQATPPCLGGPTEDSRGWESTEEGRAPSYSAADA